MCNSVEQLDLKQECQHKISRFRVILPQVIATVIQNIYLVEMGFIFALQTITIAAMTGIANDYDQIELMSITSDEATWIGSICFLCQPLGSFLSILSTDLLGRRLAMNIVNIPLIIGWFLLYESDAFWKIITGFAFLGVAMGLMDSSLPTYLGEICEPSTRGVLTAYSQIGVPLGSFIAFYLNTIYPWRSVALLCLIVSVATIFANYLIPETPQWLLSKNRTAEAEKSLRWLRGWSSSEFVAQEFNDLKQHNEYTKSCSECIKQMLKCNHPPPKMIEKFVELKQKRTLKPLFIIASMFSLAQISGSLSMRPFILQIFKAYDSPILPDHATTIISLVDNLGTISFILLVRYTGKRCIYLIMVFGIFLCSMILACYGFIYLPSGYTSFIQTHETNLENSSLAWIPFFCLQLWSFFSLCALYGLPWMLLSEIFTFKARGIANGVSGAFNCILGFITRKTYYNMEMMLSLSGVALFYSIFCGLGFFLMYFILPETEDYSLEDIERHFSDDSKKITDHKIVKTQRKSYAKYVECSNVIF